MKKIILLLCVCISVPVVFGAGGDIGYADTSYGDYLVIKYLLFLYDFPQAEDLIDRCLAKYPEDPFVLTEKAWLEHRVKNDPNQALELVKKSRAIYPDYYYSNFLQASILFTQYSGTGPQGELDQPLSAEQKKMAEEALKYLEISLNDNPEFHDSLLLKGMILSELGRCADSNKVFKAANRIKQTIQAYEYMSFNYSQLKDTDGEIRSYQRILAINPGHYHAILGLSRIYLEQRDFKKAAPYLEKLFQRTPGDWKVIVEYLYSLFATGETEKFMKISRELDISKSPLLTHARAVILGRQKKYAEAEKLLEALEKKDANTYVLLAETYLYQQDYYRAYQVIDQIEKPEGSQLYYSMRIHTLGLVNLNRRIVELFDQISKDKNIVQYLGESDYYTVLFACSSLGMTGKLLEVTQFANKHLEEKSADLTALAAQLQGSAPGTTSGKLKFDRNVYLIMNLYKTQEQYDKAAALLKKSCGTTNTPDPCMELCDIYREQGLLKKAHAILKKLRKQFPTSSTVKNFYAYFLALENKNLDHALELSAETLTGEDIENPAYLDTYGFILLRSGRIDEAGTFLEKAYAKHPFEKEIMEHLADYYRLKKQENRVLEIYRKAIDHNVDFKDELLEKIKKLENKK